MNRFVHYAVLALLLVGFGQKEEAETARVVIAQQQATKALWEQQQAEKNAAIALANQKAAEEKAAMDREQAAIEKSSSQRGIFDRPVGAMLGLFIGIGLGSSSRKTAAEASKVSSG